MAKKKKEYSEEDGVWRTIGGRRVFIRKGQSLSDAMKESGKFKTGNRREVQVALAEKREKKLGKENEDIWEKTNKFDDNWYDENGKLTKEGEKLNNKREKNAKELEDISKYYREYSDNYPMQWRDDRYNEPKEYTGNLSELKGKHIADKQDKFYTRKDGTKEYDPYKGTRFEKKYDSMEDVIKDPNSALNKYISEKEPRDELKEISGGAISTLQTTTPKSKADRLKPGTEIYYTGDQANIPGYFTIESFEPEKEQYLASITLKEKGGEGRTFKIGSQSIASEYGKDPGARFSFKEDYDNYRNQVFENYRKIAREGKTTDWREQVKKNNELMEKELAEYKRTHDISRESDDYYEIFRNNERRNAKIKQEVPTEPYEYVEAYAGYHDKSYKLAGTKMSGKDVVEYGRKSWTGREYTNDEFMEHLTDSNWHQERKMLEEAKLTNQELAYIKDRTTLSQWSVGEELTGSKNVEKMIKEAKNHFTSDSNSLMNRYSNTVDYLKNTKNMSGADILEMLKKIDEDRK